jgi:hypothetical protein
MVKKPTTVGLLDTLPSLLPVSSLPEGETTVSITIYFEVSGHVLALLRIEVFNEYCMCCAKICKYRLLVSVPVHYGMKLLLLYTRACIFVFGREGEERERSDTDKRQVYSVFCFFLENIESTM